MSAVPFPPLLLLTSWKGVSGKVCLLHSLMVIVEVLDERLAASLPYSLLI